MSRAPHDVLGVRPGATEGEVDAAFRRYARRHHPDAGGDPALFQEGVAAARAMRGRRGATAPPNVTFRPSPPPLPVALLRSATSFVSALKANGLKARGARRR